MIAEKIFYENFRNIEAEELRLTPGVNVLWGKNAQGKSNFLEGLYYFARGRSFRGATDRQMVKNGEPYSSLTLSYRSEGDSYSRDLGVAILENGKKEMMKAGARVHRMNEIVGNFRAVLFCPDHLSLVTGSPAERRSFLDIALSQISFGYLGAITGYMKTMKARNSLLKQAAEGRSVSRAEWESYAEILSRLGIYITQVRVYYMEKLMDSMEDCFLDMTFGHERPALRYLPVVEGMEIAPCRGGKIDSEPLDRTSQEKIYQALLSDLPHEIRMGTTLYGIHRDDMEITLNGRSAKLYASQGQTRSLALAMKLGEGAISRQLGGEEPVYLLDDVFSELDADRRSYLLSSIGERQVVITSCEPEQGVRMIPRVSLFRIEDGKIAQIS